jgi:transcriptional regulator with XRE-family HTH domain
MDLGLHQTDAARKIGVTASTICNWESGRVTDPEIRHGPGIVSFLGYVPMERPSTLTAQLRALAEKGSTKDWSRPDDLDALGTGEYNAADHAAKVGASASRTILPGE